MDSEIKEGSLVVSNMGHDKGRTYLVLEISNGCAKCVDGNYRVLGNPKTKRIKHLNNCCKNFNNLIEKYKNGKLYDFEVKTVIKNEVKMHKV